MTEKLKLVEDARDDAIDKYNRTEKWRAQLSDEYYEFKHAHSRTVVLKNKIQDVLNSKLPNAHILISEHEIKQENYRGGYDFRSGFLISWENGPTKDTVKSIVEISDLVDSTSTIEYRRAYATDLVLEYAQKIIDDNNYSIKANLNNITCMKIADCSIKMLVVNELRLKEL